MVRVLAVADEEVPSLTVEKLRALKPDVVVACGDLSWDYVEYVVSATDRPTVFVPGNHDPEVVTARALRNGTYWRDGRPCDAPRPRGAINADGRIVQVAGLTIAGLGGSVRYRPGPNQYSQREFHRRAKKLRRAARRVDRVDLLLTHAPPRGLGDGDDGPHEGIEALHDVLADLRPQWHLHGHIHPYGHTKPDRQVGGTTLRNVIPFAVVELTPQLVAG